MLQPDGGLVQLCVCYEVINNPGKTERAVLGSSPASFLNLSTNHCAGWWLSIACHDIVVYIA